MIFKSYTLHFTILLWNSKTISWSSPQRYSFDSWMLFTPLLDFFIYLFITLVFFYSKQNLRY